MNFDDVFKKWIDREYVTEGSGNPFRYSNYGYFLRHDDGSGFIGGPIQEIDVDENQKAIIEEKYVGTIGCCGDAIFDISEVAGQCQDCQGIACKRPGCIEVCELENILVCRNCYSIISGVVVSNMARHGLWFLRLLRIRSQKKQYVTENGYRQIPYDPNI
jgi:hypothetical protein